VDQRQVQRERAAGAGGALDPDVAAEQARQLAADGQTQPRAPVLAAGGSVDLLERLEDDPLFGLGIPMPVSVTAKATTLAAPSSWPCPWLQPDVAGEIRRVTDPWSVNLKAFDSRFFSICCTRFSSV